MVLALYDLCAVLSPCGPLKALLHLMQAREQIGNPGFIFVWGGEGVCLYSSSLKLLLGKVRSAFAVRSPRGAPTLNAGERVDWNPGVYICLFFLGGGLCFLFVIPQITDLPKVRVVEVSVVRM